MPGTMARWGPILRKCRGAGPEARGGALWGEWAALSTGRPTQGLGSWIVLLGPMK